MRIRFTFAERGSERHHDTQERLLQPGSNASSGKEPSNSSFLKDAARDCKAAAVTVSANSSSLHIANAAAAPCVNNGTSKPRTPRAAAFLFLKGKNDSALLLPRRGSGNGTLAFLPDADDPGGANATVDGGACADERQPL